MIRRARWRASTVTSPIQLTRLCARRRSSVARSRLDGWGGGPRSAGPGRRSWQRSPDRSTQSERTAGLKRFARFGRMAIGLGALAVGLGGGGVRVDAAQGGEDAPDTAGTVVL